MLPSDFLGRLENDDRLIAGEDRSTFVLPLYDPASHYLELTRSRYFYALVLLRDRVKQASDLFWGGLQMARNIDLFMLTSSVSSPSGPGSNSVAIPLQFGNNAAFLVDSSQFGFEPLMINGFERVYCYLPSMRGEDFDRRHLNQFFHCEAEVVGDLDSLLPLVEDYVRYLSATILAMPAVAERLSGSGAATQAGLQALMESRCFPCITFDEAAEALEGQDGCVIVSGAGRTLTPRGESAIFSTLGVSTPLWVRGYERDSTPFYQKPHPSNPDRVVNADLLFPPLIEGSFAGEVVGCGQRQDDPSEMLESLRRQGLSSDPYLWYIELRRHPGYRPTSGFGLGIERFLAWALCRDDIRDVIIYPRLKNVVSFP